MGHFQQLITIGALCCSTMLYSQNFDDHFINATLRIDYIFTGTQGQCVIAVDELCRFDGWAGRRVNLSTTPLKGNGQIAVNDIESGECLYTQSFSTLFQEWTCTPEARTMSKAFQNTFLIPFPKETVEVEIVLFTASEEPIAGMKHTVNPDDILIRKITCTPPNPRRYLVYNGSPEECIDIVIIGEGYQENQAELFFSDAETVCESIFSHEPFNELMHRFNVLAIANPSQDSGVSIPHEGIWKNTALGATFDTFYTARYLTTSHTKAIHDVVAGIPYEHVIILANTDHYGGGGIYNAFTLVSARDALLPRVIVHEFGHAFAGLADEYFYPGDALNNFYDQHTEPWEPNITTLVNFSHKWQDMLSDNTPIPTPLDQIGLYPIGVYQGAGYAEEGIYRPEYECRMRSNGNKGFCAVCRRAIERMIAFYTE